VLGSVIVVAIWKEAGFFMIFYLAALQTLSPSYKEAAQIEGASSWYFFRRIQWPLLMPTTIFVLVNALINALVNPSVNALVHSYDSSETLVSLLS
jgi:sn-glycerol 3-phosphate transport system permease protein